MTKREDEPITDDELARVRGRWFPDSWRVARLIARIDKEMAKTLEARKWLLEAGRAAAWRCVEEEWRELNEAKTLPELAKEAADLIVTVMGLACVYGIDMEPVFEAVMASNDTKTGEKDGAGKVVKGPGYVPPDITKVLENQGWAA